MKKLVIKKVYIRGYTEGLVCIREKELIQASEMLAPFQNLVDEKTDHFIPYNSQFEWARYAKNYGVGSEMYIYFDPETGITWYSKELNVELLGK